MSTMLETPAPSIEGQKAKASIPSGGVLQLLPLKSLRESPFNPRQRFPKAEMLELTESIKAHGILDNPTVRPIYGVEGSLTESFSHYEIVKGHRRVRCGITAGLTETECLVKEMTEIEAREIQLIELWQSHDPHALEQAMAYKGLVEAGRTVPEIAAAIGGKGMSASHVYQQIKLCELIPEAQTAFLNDRFTPAHAVPVARLNAADQKKALAWLLYGYIHNVKKIDVDEGPPTEFSVIALKNWIANNCHLRLSAAPFPLADALLYEKAGSCTVCPKNSDHNRNLFADVPSGDAICADSGCYHTKTKLFLEDEVSEKENQYGQKVIKVSAKQHPGEGTPGILAAEKWKLAVEGHCGKEQKAMIAEAGYRDGRNFELTTMADICTDRKCKIHWQKPKAQASGSNLTGNKDIASHQAKQASEKARLSTIRAVRLEAVKHILAKTTPASAEKVYPELAKSHSEMLSADGLKVIAALMGWAAPPKGPSSLIGLGALDKRLGSLSRKELDRWFVAVMCVISIDDEKSPLIEQLSKSANVDLKKLEKEYLFEAAKATYSAEIIIPDAKGVSRIKGIVHINNKAWVSVGSSSLVETLVEVIPSALWKGKTSTYTAASKRNKSRDKGRFYEGIEVSCQGEKYVLGKERMEFSPKDKPATPKASKPSAKPKAPKPATPKKPEKIAKSIKKGRDRS